LTDQADPVRPRSTRRRPGQCGRTRYLAVTCLSSSRSEKMSTFSLLGPSVSHNPPLFSSIKSTTGTGPTFYKLKDVAL
jgi:hypothetical protein